MRELILFILDWLRQKLDPDYAADLAAYRTQREAQQALIANETAALAEDTNRVVHLQTERQELNRQLTELTNEVDQLETQRTKVHDDLRTKLDALARVDPDDLRRAPL
jgi:septal ring factor EnvC (AmiA/AmiB activator)